MKVFWQIIERDPALNTVTVRFTTEQVAAEQINPQMEDGMPKLREDRLVARCDSDLSILSAQFTPTRVHLHIPADLLHAAELAVYPEANPAVESIVELPEQSITHPT